VKFATTNTKGTTGDGHKLAMAAGAATVDMEHVQVRERGFLHPRATLHLGLGAFGFQQRRWRAAERRHPTDRERMGSPTLQTLQDPILLGAWVCFLEVAFQTLEGYKNPALAAVSGRSEVSVMPSSSHPCISRCKTVRKMCLLWKPIVHTNATLHRVSCALCGNQYSA
jgi:hypothetical protein